MSSTTVPTRGDHAHARIRLDAGDNRLQAQCLAEGAPRGQPVVQHWLVRARDVPIARVRLRITATEIVLDAGASELAPARPAPLSTCGWRVRAGANPGPLPGLPAVGKQVALARPTVDGEYFVTLRVTDAAGRFDESTAMFRVRRGRTEIFGPAHEHAAWIDRAIVYGVEPLSFGRRGLADVIVRLPAIKALGVNTLWLTPITDAPDEDFGYAVTDQFRVRDALGGDAELRELIAQAHADGLRVVLDLVANHLSEQHPYFADTALNGRSSPYYDFFQRVRAGAAVHYFGWHNLENLNFDSPEVQRMIIEASARWVRDYDVDGFRVDAAWGPRQRAPDFWPRWSAELKRIKPDLMLLAEASSQDGYYSRSGFAAAYDWTEKLGQWAWQNAFADERQTAERLRSALRDTQARSSSLSVFRFLDNNDSGPRFITQHGVEQTRVAAAMLLTLPGIPALYSGDDVGAAFEPYRPHGPLQWDDPHGLRAWYTRLIALRARLPALRSRQLHVLDTGAADQILAYLRPAEGDGGVLVLLNFSGTDASVSLPMEMIRTGWRTNMVEQLSGAHIAANDDGAIILPAYGIRILQRLPEKERPAPRVLARGRGRIECRKRQPGCTD
ncbi:alpha-amylase family glycosyl hydrolase [Bradyrhizobium sp.]|uniref:alpha-amylase family glycosyl hydrolase n=1 Tax=Bradyrhizobium sp. TaxID=376 RepID=UPI0025C4EC10|nr:alpha-amylase family glycosyl hydrolase [Bradyrhizobium sp.]